VEGETVYITASHSANLSYIQSKITALRGLSSGKVRAEPRIPDTGNSSKQRSDSQLERKCSVPNPMAHLTSVSRVLRHNECGLCGKLKQNFGRERG